MSTQVTCDFCGEAVENIEDKISLEVTQVGWLKLVSPSLREGGDVPDRFDRKLDLHVSCYAEHYRANIEQKGQV